MGQIAVIVVNYNAAELAVAAVESVLAREHGGRQVEIHLVDNASPAGDGPRLADAARARGWAERVTLWLEERNHGFGRGNNLVLDTLLARASPPEHVFLLNPDAALGNEALDILAGFLERHDRVAAAGARIEKPGRVPVTAAFRFPSVVSVFCESLALGPVSRALARWQVPLPPETAESRVGWVAGAAVMFRLSALRQTGGFDPAFFLYFEEVELMRRLARSGWETWHVPAAEVTHIEGASTEVRSGETRRRRRPAYWYESWRLYFDKTLGRAGALAAFAAWILGAALNLPISRLRGREPAAPPGFFADAWGMVGRPLLGLGARPYD